MTTEYCSRGLLYLSGGMYLFYATDMNHDSSICGLSSVSEVAWTRLSCKGKSGDERVNMKKQENRGAAERDFVRLELRRLATGGN